MLSGIHLSLYSLLLKRLSSFFILSQKKPCPKTAARHTKNRTQPALYSKEIFAILPISQDRLLKIYFTVRIVSLYAKNVNRLLALFLVIIYEFLYIKKALQMRIYASVSVVLRTP